MAKKILEFLGRTVLYFAEIVQFAVLTGIVAILTIIRYLNEEKIPQPRTLIGTFKFLWHIDMYFWYFILDLALGLGSGLLSASCAVIAVRLYRDGYRWFVWVIVAIGSLLMMAISFYALGLFLLLLIVLVIIALAVMYFFR